MGRVVAGLIYVSEYRGILFFFSPCLLVFFLPPTPYPGPVHPFLGCEGRKEKAALC